MTADDRNGGIVNVFISHNHEDEVAAKTIKGELALYGANRLNFFLSEEITPGDDWCQWINERLVTSNVLLLLFTDPSATWDWCLYEAGLFARLDRSEGEQNRRVLCLHNPKTDPPSQLRHLQTVKVDPPHMRSFLKQLFGTAKLTAIEPPINSAFAENEEALTQVANKLCTVIAPVNPERRYYHPDLTLWVKAPSRLTNGQIPGDTVIETDRTALELFGLDECPPGRDHWTWGELQQNAQRAEDQEWVEALGRTLSAASQGRSIEPIQATFQALPSGKLYRPVLRRRDLERDGSMRFSIVLVEQFSEALAYVPEPLGTLLTGLTMATRFRWHIIEHYLNLTPGWRTPQARAEGCQQLLQAIVNIEKAAAYQRFITRNRLRDAFADPKECRQVDALYTQWGEIRQELDQVLQRNDLGEITRLLEQSKGLNAEFMVLASKRYHELLREINGHEVDEGSAMIHAVAS
jgi:hypothetical protein